MMYGLCQLCNRDEVFLTKHHLIPRSCHTKKRCKEFGSKINRIANLCRDCHSKLHATWSHKDLADYYNSIEVLKLQPDIHKFVKWIRKQKTGKRFRSKKVQ